jgi:peptidoglycan/LPS O-acetylase OafA/YrhL
VRQPADAVGRFLNRRSVATVGVLSYSAYLWQQMFTDPDGASVRFPLNVAGFVVATGLSFYCIERPLLGLRVRLRSRVSRHSTLAP